MSSLFSCRHIHLKYALALHISYTQYIWARIYSRFMISFCWRQHPHFGYSVNPTIVKASGTSSLHGTAAVMTAQQAWHCALTQLIPSHSRRRPTQQQGMRQGAPGLQQHSALRQQIPAYVVVGVWIDVDM